MSNLSDIGLIGLAVMGENLVLNMESHGFSVAVFNRTVEKVDNFTNGRGKGKKAKRRQGEKGRVKREPCRNKKAPHLFEWGAFWKKPDLI